MTREGNTGSDGMWWAKKLFKKQSKREGKKTADGQTWQVHFRYLRDK